jgi:metal-sulfur cluster biosynthetic enzyme
MIHLETDKDREIFAQIETVHDPEIGLPITEMGLVYEIATDGSQANIKMTFTSMACPMGAQIKAEVEESCLRVDGIDSVDVEIVWSPRWDPKEMATDMAKDYLGIF